MFDAHRTEDHHDVRRLCRTCGSSSEECWDEIASKGGRESREARPSPGLES